MWSTASGGRRRRFIETACDEVSGYCRRGSSADQWLWSYRKYHLYLLPPDKERRSPFDISAYWQTDCEYADLRAGCANAAFARRSAGRTIHRRRRPRTRLLGAAVFERGKIHSRSLQLRAGRTALPER